MTNHQPIVLFDGVCHLCAGSVQFIARRDRGQFRFASLQSAVGRELLRRHGLPADFLDGLVLIEDEAASTHSTAALLIARGLRWPWRALGVFRFVPRWLRDAVYRFIAQHRYRWFGRGDECMMPTPALAARFLDGVESPDDRRKLPVATQEVTAGGLRP